MAPLLQGSAFISGGSSGIGKAAAFAFAEHGVQKLAIAGRNQKKLDITAKELKDKFPQLEVLALSIDVAKEEEVKAGFSKLKAAFGRLDIAVNNAGITGRPAPTHETSEEEYMDVINVNLMGIYRCQKQEIILMLEQEDLGPRRGRGVILNIASIMSYVSTQPPFGCPAYCTAKHGMLGLTKSDAVTYAEKNIRINALCPGFVDTPLLIDEVRTAVIPLTPMRRMATPEEIADSIVILSSSMNSFAQGSGWIVDGGYTAI
ncbi:hypothetical protein CDD81_3995 [Ophiocordyceps australis]|uniref:Uncharacterized protein n=1 Tax=Ophiocordyceps australis TaxID=1399860 RepID=A0A2C5YAT7_9HYPO|nr:hypothetical protein CDD81_3995 [Ophiocordyceps australis]